MEESRDLPKLFNSMDYWIKFSKYEIIEDNGDLYIRPEKNSRFESYNPEDKHPRILIDFISMAEAIGRAKDDYGQAKEVVKFVNKYGLLGLHDLWVYSFVNKFKYQSEHERNDREIKKELAKQKLDSVSLLSEDYNKYFDEYMASYENNLFTRAVILKRHNPFGNILRNAFDPESEYYDYFEWEYQGYAALFFPGMTEPYPDFESENDSFWRNYSEPLYAYKYLIYKAFNSLYMWALDLSEFEKGEYSYEDQYGHDKHWRGKYHKSLEDDAVARTTWRDFLTNTINFDNIGVGINFDDKNRTLKYSANTLYDAMCLLFIQNAVSNKQTVKQCKNPKCENWFISKSPKSQYCSTSCGTSVRVERFRKGKSNT
ncbi:CGNR zinc finger domain-containing protein [Desulfosporosinus sp.]|uniref:CGNR zinc finger domain-containing protein n=1 Tax=Desulfosporosinus sp. TaxID=157907 RepID=UPI0026192F9C|nr:CGNR zinc finger domain-containing protein [Desulfosporosinus sp.]MCO5384439.1 CGNR zinc finger domain-containing protein [Desulfosporosinus sp.]